MAQSRDPYEVLGVSRTASDEEIKTKYRELVKKYHPDRYKGHPLEDLAIDKMQEINEAYAVLTSSSRNSNQGTGYTGQRTEYSDFGYGRYQNPYQGQGQGQNPYQNSNPYQNRQNPYQDFYGGGSEQDCCQAMSILCCMNSCLSCCGGGDGCC